MNTTHEVPLPTEATETSEWADVGTPDEFRTFEGPTRTIPDLLQQLGPNDVTDSEATGLLAILQQAWDRKHGAVFDADVIDLDFVRLGRRRGPMTAVRITCPVCGARPGQPCRNITDGQLRLPHLSRRYRIGALAPPRPGLR